MSEFNGIDMERLQDFLDEMRGDNPKTPAAIVFEEMSTRLTKNSGQMDRMRIETFLGDLISITENAIVEVAEGKKGKEDEVLLEEVKSSSGYGSMINDIGVTDKTILGFINEAKIRLANQYQILPNQDNTPDSIK